MFQCQRRQQWRHQFENKLLHQLQTLNTSSEDQEDIQQNIYNILNDNQQHQHFHHFKMFGGLLPIRWGRTTNNTNGSSKYTLWQVKMSRWFTQQGHELWLQRNQQNKPQEDNTPLQQRLHQQIQKLYALQDEVPYLDKTLFDTPIEERLQMTDKRQQIWIDETTKTVQKSMAEHTEKMSNGQTDIRQFTQSGKIQ